MKLFIILVLFCLAATAQQKNIFPPHLDYYLTGKGTLRDVVFKFDAKRDSGIFEKNANAATLSTKEIAVVERLIIQQVTAYNSHKKAGGDVIKKPEKYYKQFIAVTNAKGGKEVWVNCCCGIMREYWKTAIQTTLDGGNCYFRIKINLAKATVLYFSVNGLA